MNAAKFFKNLYSNKPLKQHEIRNFAQLFDFNMFVIIHFSSSNSKFINSILSSFYRSKPSQLSIPKAFPGNPQLQSLMHPILL